MYADTITDSMQRAISETNRRRKIQMEYNQKHGITPTTVRRACAIRLKRSRLRRTMQNTRLGRILSMQRSDIEALISKLEKEMRKRQGAPV